jgi:hypothetical protein
MAASSTLKSTGKLLFGVLFSSAVMRQLISSFYRKGYPESERTWEPEVRNRELRITAFRLFYTLVFILQENINETSTIISQKNVYRYLAESTGCLYEKPDVPGLRNAPKKLAPAARPLTRTEIQQVEENKVGYEKSAPDAGTAPSKLVEPEKKSRESRKRKTEDVADVGSPKRSVSSKPRKSSSAAATENDLGLLPFEGPREALR